MATVAAAAAQAAAAKAAAGGLGDADMAGGVPHRRAPSCCSRACLCWVTPKVWEGFSRPLPAGEMPGLLAGHATRDVAPRAFALWDAEIRGATAQRPASLLRVCRIMHGPVFFTGLTLGGIQGVLNSAARPLLLNYLILAFMPNSEYTATESLLLLAVFALVVLVEGWFKVLVTNLLAVELPANLVAWMIPLVQKKAARIRRIPVEDIPVEDSGSSSNNDSSKAGSGSDADTRARARSDSSGGDTEMPAAAPSEHGGEVAASSEVALVGKDILETCGAINWVSNFPQCIVGIVAGSITLVYLLGIPSLIGMATMLFTLSLNRLFAALGGRYAALDLQAGDARLGVMREIVESIVPLKFLCWEDSYLNLIDAKREEECKYLLKYRALVVASITIGRVAPVLASCATFTFMGLMGYELSPNIIFGALAAFNAMRMPLITIPLNVIQLAVMNVSLRRLQGFFCLPEHTLLPPVPEDLAEGEGGASAAVLCQGARFTWAEQRGAITTTTSTTEAKTADGGGGGGVLGVDARGMSDPISAAGFGPFDLRVPKGQLVAVCGRVGQGKSTLLSALLGELALVEGRAFADAEDIGYVPQKPFVLSGTVLDNIVMGREFTEAALRRALKSSDFEADLTLMPRGLETEIGERGMTLSGGQKQRLAIARAVYGDPSLLLIDDALAAVDGKVASRIFDSICVGRRAAQAEDGKKRTTLCAINQLQFLDQFDMILFVENGNVSQRGTYAELLELSGTFAEMVAATSHGGDSLDDAADGQEKEEEKASPAAVAGEDHTTAPAGQKAQEVVAVLDEGGPGGGAEEAAAAAAAATGDDATTATTAVSRLVEEDTRQVGTLSGKAMRYYLKSAGGAMWLVPAMMLGLLAYSLFAATDLWLAAWVGDGKNTTAGSTTYRASVYVGLSAGQSLMVLALSLFNNRATNRASRSLHHNTLVRLLHAPQSWYQKTPSGRIMSRFSADLSLMDKMFSYITDDCMQFTGLLLALLVTICYVLPPMAIVLVVGLLVYTTGVLAVDRTNREAKREGNLALSPMMTILAESVSGRQLVHAMRFEPFFEKRERRATDAWNRFLNFSGSVQNWGTLLVNIVAFAFSVSAAVMVYVQRDEFASDDEIAKIGVALNYSFVLPYFLGLYSILCTLWLSGATSVERVLDFVTGDLPQERPWKLPNDPSRDTFPKNGRLVLDNVSLNYRQGLPDAISNVSLDVPGGSRIGIVGRTGAGKSSLIVALFRLVDRPLLRGRVELDGVDLNDIGLHTARRALAIVPQTPLLLTPGTCGHNLDPFGHYSKERIEQSLEKVGLSKAVVDTEASELSSGQQQLLALARLLMREGDERPAFIVMDEPTANIDAQTDENIQRVIDTEFAGITLLTIAHRLNTVIGCDKMLVMDQGKVGEWGTPRELLSREGGLLSGMVDALGESTARRLRDLAEGTTGDGVEAKER